MKLYCSLCGAQIKGRILVHWTYNHLTRLLEYQLNRYTK